jgi:ribosomal-protein-alanine N-acetyltransferase
MMQFEYLETERLRLRAITRDVYRYAFETLSFNEQLIFFGVASEAALAPERRKYEGGLETYRSTFRYFHLLDRMSGDVIGTCGFHNWFPEHRRAEIGYAMTSETQKGKGLMREALDAVLAHGFHEMNLNRVEAFIGPGNLPSLKLAQGAGFRQEGHLRQHYFHNGALQDSLVFGLLKADYDTKRQEVGSREVGTEG